MCKILFLCRTFFAQYYCLLASKGWSPPAQADCQILGSSGNIPIVLESSLSLDKCNVLQSTKHFINECWHCTFRGTNKEESMALCPRSLQSKLDWQYRSGTQDMQKEGWHFSFPFVLCKYRYKQWQQTVKHLSPGPHGFSRPPVHKHVSIFFYPSSSCCLPLFTFLPNLNPIFFFFFSFLNFVLPTRNISLQK